MAASNFFYKNLPSGILVLFYLYSSASYAATPAPNNDKATQKPAATAESTKAKTDSTKKKSTPAAKEAVPAGPVLNDATQKQLNDTGKSIDAETKQSMNAVAKTIKEED